VYPPEFFSHPRLAAFCHRTKIWREVDSLLELSIRLRQTLHKAEIKQFESEFSSFDKSFIPNIVDIYSLDYPPLLREIYDPPLVLGYLGNLNLLNQPLVGIVGTRKASKVSLLATKLLVTKLRECRSDLAIVSGMALGIDRQAFISAMECGMGVVGLLGTSLMEEYPPGNLDLYRKVKFSPNAVLVSEYIFPTTPARWTFPKRNRLISGLVTDVYIMESGKRSGTLSTAMSALSQNREIHVFDHPLQLDNEGGKNLLMEGAGFLDFDSLSQGKGRIETPNFCSTKDVLGQDEWMVIADLERSYRMEGKKTPLGRGAYWVSST